MSASFGREGSPAKRARRAIRLLIPIPLRLAAALLAGMSLSAFSTAAEPSDADVALGKLAERVVGRWAAEVKPAQGEPITIDLNYEWAGHRKSTKYVIVLKYRIEKKGKKTR